MTRTELEQLAAIGRYTANFGSIRPHWVLTIYGVNGDKSWTIDGPYWTFEMGRTALAYVRVIRGLQAELWTIESDGGAGKWVPEGEVITEETDND